MLRTVASHAQKRDIARAAAIAEQALAEGFEHPLLLNVAAMRLEAEGRFEEAVRLLERAVVLAPGDVPARNALALNLQRVVSRSRGLSVRSSSSAGALAAQLRERMERAGIEPATSGLQSRRSPS